MHFIKLINFFLSQNYLKKYKVWGLCYTINENDSLAIHQKHLLNMKEKGCILSLVIFSVWWPTAGMGSSVSWLLHYTPHTSANESKWLEIGIFSVPWKWWFGGRCRYLYSQLFQVHLTTQFLFQQWQEAEQPFSLSPKMHPQAFPLTVKMPLFIPPYPPKWSHRPLCIILGVLRALPLHADKAHQGYLLF